MRCFSQVWLPACRMVYTLIRKKNEGIFHRSYTVFIHPWIVNKCLSIRLVKIAQHLKRWHVIIDRNLLWCVTRGSIYPSLFAVNENICKHVWYRRRHKITETQCQTGGEPYDFRELLGDFIELFIAHLKSSCLYEPYDFRGLLGDFIELLIARLKSSCTMQTRFESFLLWHAIRGKIS